MHAQGPDRHQRLPAAQRRDSVICARARGAAARRRRGRLRAGLGGRRRVRPGAAVPGDPPPRQADAAVAVGPEPGHRTAARARLRHGAVRRRRAARAAGAEPAPGGGAPDRGTDARARGGLGRAAGRALAAAPGRLRRRRAHLPRGVLPGPALQGAHPRGGRSDGPARARGRPGRVPARFWRLGGAQAARRRPGPAGRRLRVPDGAAQGAGHAHPGLAAGAGGARGRGDAGRGWAGRGRAAADAGRRRALPRAAGTAGGKAWRGRLGAVHRAGRLGRAAVLLRRRQHLRDAVPDPAGGPGRGGPWHRLPGGFRDRPAGRRR